jgi:hypothetical protein
MTAPKQPHSNDSRPSIHRVEDVLVEAPVQDIQSRQEQSEIPDDRQAKQEPKAPSLFLPGLQQLPPHQPNRRMKTCPKCQGKSLVTDSRQTPVQTYRRRECQNYPCRHAWTTYEIHGDEFDKISKYNDLKTIISEHLQ